jgi:hypothetical protein
MTETNSSLNDLIAQRDALTEKIAELKKGRSEAIKKIIAVMGRFAISIDEIQLALPSAAPINASDSSSAKAPYTGKKRGRKPKGTPGHADPSGGSRSDAGGSDAGNGAAGPAASGDPLVSDLLQNAEPGAAGSPSATDAGTPADSANPSDDAGVVPSTTGVQTHSDEDAERSAAQRPGQSSNDEANPIPSAAPSAD